MEMQYNWHMLLHVSFDLFWEFVYRASLALLLIWLKYSQSSAEWRVLPAQGLSDHGRKNFYATTAPEIQNPNTSWIIPNVFDSANDFYILDFFWAWKTKL